MKIYVINLPQSNDRRNSINEQFQRFDSLDYELFTAVDGNYMPDALQRKVNDEHRIIWRSRPLTRGEKGVYASNYLLWKKCVELNEPIVIAEDDIKLNDNFQQSIELASSFIDQGFDYIRLAKNLTSAPTRNVPKNKHIEYILDNQSGSTICYAISPNGAKKLLDASDVWLCSVDNFVGEAYRTKLPCIALTPHCCTISEFNSTIQKESKTRVHIMFKLTRELYRFYRFLKLQLWNRLFQFKYLPPQK
ncbi:glycosyltransferase family 25 protein [Vibrio coralliilyticus]|uniref:glycosyltransferase family 25 protein n=1 Tax=Vibrio coralliilyticus TaxID=190893 RepID=UPI00148C1199|nr:glycosyltransferase family 25 protein [Vibrio coralliilyticus]NOH55556.1 glycosyltransferase family 25 protein [Vibrio coralliilyticus]